MHPAIVDAELFEAVQARLDANRQQRAARRDRVARAPLTGRIFDADGQPMSPTFSYGRRRKLYRYYVSAPLQQGSGVRAVTRAIRRVPAPALEARLTGVLRRLAPSAVSDPLDLPSRVEIQATSVELLLPAALGKACTAASTMARRSHRIARTRRSFAWSCRCGCSCTAAGAGSSARPRRRPGRTRC